MHRATLAVLIALGANTPFSAQTSTINARCSLVIDGKTRFDHRCHFQASRDGIDYFSDNKLMIICPNGKPVEVASCEGSQQKVVRKGVFGFLYRDGSSIMPSGNGTSANICWNYGYMIRAEACLDGLTRDGACWKSNSAKDRHADKWHNVRFCAYRL